MSDPNPINAALDDQRHEEYQYLDLIRRILDTGEIRGDRTGTGTKAIFAPPSLRFSLRNNTLPLLTTKRVFTRAVITELLWFISGNTSSLPLSAAGIKIWDGNGSRQNLDSLGFTDRADGDLGPVYGFQWRHFGAEYKGCDADYTGQGVDQLADVMEKIMNNPTPCHMFAQFYVSNEGELSCCLYQRSCDMGLGVPFNIASYALLTHILAHAAGLKPGDLVHCMGDTHVYLDHVDALREQLEREPRDWPKIRFAETAPMFGGGLQAVDQFKVEDFVVEGYNPHGKIEMKMSV